MTISGKMLAALAVAVGALATGPVGVTPAHAGCRFWLTNAETGEGVDDCEPDPPPVSEPAQTSGVDPCYIAQNAMRPCNSEQKLVDVQKPVGGVDRKFVGTWMFPTGSGFWVLEISGNGTYRFHSEANDNVAANAGTFSAGNGHWALTASSGYTDSGSYSFQSAGAWIARGQRGTAVWLHRS